MDTDKELMLDVGQANEIKMAARRAGATNADLKKLSTSDMFAKILPVIRGLAQVVIAKCLINCDADPFLPDGWRVVAHQKGGQLELDPSRIRLYLSKGQKGDKCIGGHDLRKELENQPVLNANVLDYLLSHQDFIPESWKSKVTYFWGTIYSNGVGYLCVRCLDWRGGRWYWGGRWLDGDWDDGDPSALLVA